jgi:heme/copper-type cytochrome/quinol oxidase subunit 3
MIPYTVDRRSDTGVNNVTFGIWLFLASEVMLFGALFSAYALLSVSAAEWPSGREVLSLSFGATNTIILFLLTGTAWRSRSTPLAQARRWLLASSVCALAFLGVKATEWQGEINAGLVPSVSTFWGMYYTLTGLHALHVIGGLIANAWALSGAGRVGEPMTMGRFQALALYWAFVDAVWIVIFVLLYLM